MWDGAWPQIFRALTVNYSSPPTLNLLPTPMQVHVPYGGSGNDNRKNNDIIFHVCTGLPHHKPLSSSLLTDLLVTLPFTEAQQATSKA